MTYAVPEGVLPTRVQLSEAHKSALMDEADRVVAETLEANELFISSGRKLPADRWKHIKAREKLHVYRTRRSRNKGDGGHSADVSKNEKDPSRPRLLSNTTVEQQQREAMAAGVPHAFADDPELDRSQSCGSHTHSSSSDCGSFSLTEDSVLEKVKPAHVPLVVVTGLLDGSVEDVGYGALAHTPLASHVRNLYVKGEEYDGRRVLATLQSPEDEDPFRYVVIKWSTRNFGTFITRRDFLMMESTGIAFDADGERVFYRLTHSIELPDCPPMPSELGVIRVQMSICYIAREVGENKVEMYARGFVDPGGDMPVHVGITLLSNAMASVASIVECSYLKKLCWLMNRRRRSDAANHQMHRRSVTGDCGVCGKGINKLATLVQGAGTGACVICRQAICSKCGVQKKLAVDALDTDGVVLKQFTFCLSCVLESRKLSAWDVAVATLPNRT